jgi:hypothetical protein
VLRTRLRRDISPAEQAEHDGHRRINVSIDRGVGGKCQVTLNVDPEVLG